MRSFDRLSTRLTETIRQAREDVDEAVCLMVLCVMLFGLGVYVGAVITSRHHEALRQAQEALGARCLERMEEINAAAAGLEARTREVLDERLFLGKGKVQPGEQPRLQGVHRHKEGG